jgi:hypothetical protein
MAVEIPFRREFSFEYGRLEPVAPMIRRIVARNPSPFTFRGTGIYVVGHGEVKPVAEEPKTGGGSARISRRWSAFPEITSFAAFARLRDPRRPPAARSDARKAA